MSYQDDSNPTPQDEQGISRREFIAGALSGLALGVSIGGAVTATTVALGTMATLPLCQATAEPAQAPQVNQGVLDYLESLKAQWQPVTDLLAYIELGAYGHPLDADTLVQLWDVACPVAETFDDWILGPELEHNFYALVGKDTYREACARNLEGYEL